MIFQKAGFSLVQILVALGLVAIIGAALATVITTAAKQQKGVQAKDQQRDITSEMRSLLSNKTACTNSFAVGKNPETLFEVTTLNDELGAAKFQTTKQDKTKQLIFNKFTIDNWQPDGASITLGKADLKVYLSKVGDTGSSLDIKPDTMTLRVTRDATTKNLVSCFYVGTQSDSLWQVAANMNDIYYNNNGNVGIRTTNPQTEFEVSGTMRFGSSGSGGRLSGSIPGNYGGKEVVLTTADGAGGANDEIWIGPNIGTQSGHVQIVASEILLTTGSNGFVAFKNGGNVGIGTASPVSKLDVNGNLSLYSKDAIQGGDSWLRLNQSGSFASGTHSPNNMNVSGLTVGALYYNPGAGNIEAAGFVKPGSAGVAVGSGCSLLGAQSYNSVNGAPVYCNGSSWTAVGGGTPSCQTFTSAPTVDSASISCPGGFSYAMNGSCSTNCIPLIRVELSGTTEICGSIGIKFTQGVDGFCSTDPSQRLITASIVCCK